MPSASSDFVSRVRRRAGSLVVDNAFRGLAVVSRLHPRARREIARVHIEEDVPYLPTDVVEHRLDVWRHEDAPAGPLPVVLYVHGGGFRILSKETHWIMALAFARRGYLVFNMSYRLAPAHPFPAAITDTCAALAWVHENAARFGGDPSRIVLAGESAGANLVTSAALAASYRREEPWAAEVFERAPSIRGVVAACGVFQVTDPFRLKRKWPHLPAFIHDRLLEVSESYLGPVGVEGGDACALADPVCILERGTPPERPLPPFFLPCGSKDALIGDTRRLRDALQALGVPVDARFYEGEIHAFHAFVWRPNARRCWEDTFRFLDEHAPVRPSAPAKAATFATAMSPGAARPGPASS